MYTAVVRLPPTAAFLVVYQTVSVVTNLKLMCIFPSFHNKTCNYKITRDAFTIKRNQFNFSLRIASDPLRLLRSLKSSWIVVIDLGRNMRRKVHGEMKNKGRKRDDGRIINFRHRCISRCSAIKHLY